MIADGVCIITGYAAWAIGVAAIDRAVGIVTMTSIGAFVVLVVGGVS